MVLERAEFLVKPGMGAKAEEVLKTRALALTASYTGCLSFRAMRCIENPDKILLLAEWDSVEAHLASRQEPAHVAFRELLLPYGAGGNTEHYLEIKP